MRPFRFYVVSGLLLVGLQAALCVLSPGFTGGDTVSPLLFVVFLLLFAGSFAVCFTVYRAGGDHRSQQTLRYVLLVAVLLRFLALFAAPILEDDFNRYLWDGNAGLNGINPYRHSPEALLARAEEETPLFQKSIRREAAQPAIREINYPDLKTIYPPLAQYLFMVSQSVFPWSVTGWRFLCLLADCLNIFILLKLFRKSSLIGPLCFYAWHPLILKEFVNSGHVDVFVVTCFFLFLWGILRGRFHECFVFLGLATLIKIAPAVLLPAFCFWVYRAAGWGTVCRGLALYAGTLALFYFPFFRSSWDIFGSLWTYAAEWEVNAALYALLAFLVKDPLIARVLSVLGFIGVLGFVTYRVGREKERLSFVRGCVWILGALLLFSPAGNPWYWTWLLPFLLIYPSNAFLWLTGLVGLYYASFFFLFQGKLHWFYPVQAVEYGLFFLIWGHGLWQRKIKSP